MLNVIQLFKINIVSVNLNTESDFLQISKKAWLLFSLTYFLHFAGNIRGRAWTKGC